jgi:hypothetical protein
MGFLQVWRILFAIRRQASAAGNALAKNNIAGSAGQMAVTSTSHQKIPVLDAELRAASARMKRGFPTCRAA